MDKSNLPSSSYRSFKDFEFIEIKETISKKVKTIFTSVLVYPMIKKGFVNYLKYIIIGNDLLSVEKTKISKTPFENNNSGFHSINKNIETQLLKNADLYMSQNISNYRKFILSLESMNPLKALSNHLKFDGKELVHTSYFDNVEIVKIIKKHIKKHSD